jgi:hypothetical protein
MCGRGVRARELTPEQIRHAEATVAKRYASKSKEESPSMFEMRVETMTEKLKVMVIAITEPVDTLDGAEWRELAPMERETQFESIFGRVKDRVMLEQVYHYLHDVPQDSVETILGKAQRVTL